MLLPSLVQVSESISGSVVPLAMFVLVWQQFMLYVGMAACFCGMAANFKCYRYGSFCIGMAAIWIILQVWQRFQAVIIFLLFSLSRVNIWQVKFDIQSPSHEYADIPIFTAFTISLTFKNNHKHQKSSFPSQVIVILTNAPFKGRHAHPPRDGGRVQCRKSSWWWNPFICIFVFLYSWWINSWGQLFFCILQSSRYLYLSVLSA